MHFLQGRNHTFPSYVWSYKHEMFLLKNDQRFNSSTVFGKYPQYDTRIYKCVPAYKIL